MLEALISVERKALEKTTTSNEGEEAEKAEAQQFLKDLVALSENTAKVVVSHCVISYLLMYLWNI